MSATVELGPMAAADEPELRRILRETPFPGPLSLAFEREPDWRHAAEVEGDRHAVVVGRREGRVVGFAARAVRDAWVDGAPARVGYLGQLRIQPGARGELALLGDGFRRLEAARDPDELPFDFTAIVGDNPRARRLLSSGRAGVPTYRPLGELVTLALATRPARGAPSARACPPERLPEVAAFLDGEARRFQLAPRLDGARLACPARARGLGPGDLLVVEEGGTLAAAGALWDQRAFKQTVVRGHSRAVRLARPLLRWLPGAAALLPAVGETLAAGFLAFAHARGDDPSAFGALLDAALDLAHRRGLRVLLLGLAAGHPLLAGARRHRHRAYPSTVFAVYRVEGAARVAALDGRPLAPEVALL
ncbi:MAG: hypothetical protein QM704_24955 [Anaeromyxobacteraceae bacterium]